VSALVKSDGRMLEWVKYSAYGIPFGLPNGDTDSDGDCETNDEDTIKYWSSGYDVRCDIDLDGDVDGDDLSLVQTGVTEGRAVITSSDIANARSLCGLHLNIHNSVHSRNRDFNTELGIWTQRDRMEYADGASLITALQSNPLRYQDPTGLLIGMGLTSQSSVPSYHETRISGEALPILTTVQPEQNVCTGGPANEGAPGTEQPKEGEPGFHPDYCIFSNFLVAPVDRLVEFTPTPGWCAGCDYSAGPIRFDIGKKTNGQCKVPPPVDKDPDLIYWHGSTRRDAQGNLGPVNWSSSGPTIHGLGPGSEGEFYAFGHIPCLSTESIRITATSADGTGSVGIKVNLTCGKCSFFR
jgi:hypothetical protein